MLHRWGWSALVALSLLSVAAVARGGQLDEVIAAENKSAGLKLEARKLGRPFDCLPLPSFSHCANDDLVFF